MSADIQSIINQTGLTTASEYQAAIFEHVYNQVPLVVSRKTPIALVVQAVAGSGKTTTIVAAANLIPEELRRQMVFLAFNNSIVNELEPRLKPLGIPTRTLNSLGVGIVNAHFKKIWDGRKPELDKSKTYKIMKALYTWPEIQTFGGDIKFLVGMCKSLGIVPTGMPEFVSANGLDDSDATLDWMLNHYARWVSLDIRNTLFRMTREVLRYGLERPETIDFDDQKYLPVVMRVGKRRLQVPPWLKYRIVFIDEVQDLNAVDIELIKLATGNENPFIVGVGDTNQAIYGFRGADTQAIPKFIAAFNAIELPLTITYRCARKIVEYAQTIYPTIQAAPNAPEGEVVTHGKYDAKLFSPDNDMIVCRNNAPIVALAYKLIARRIPVFVAGRDIGSGIISLIEKLKATSVVDLSGKLEDWEDTQVAQILTANPDDEEAVDRVRDRANTVRAFIDTNPDNSVDTLIDQVKELFHTKAGGNEDDHNKSQSRGKVVLSTVHKAKGLEANRVFVLDNHLFFPKWVKPGTWQETQERNLVYVAVTRPKNYLGFITSDLMKD